MDITPHVNLLKSLRGERVDYVLLVGEGIDNAFDAGAKSVAIAISDSAISFKDDGIGITRDRIGALFSLGDHGAMSTTKLGRFGVGIKSQAVNAGNIFSVDSISHDGRVLISVNWAHVLKGGQWRIDDPLWQPVLVGAPTGTKITVSDLRKTRNVSIDKIHSEIAQRFYPAIEDGHRISVNGAPVELLPEPRMTEIVDRQLSLSGGRGARLRAGLLAEPSKLNRVHVAYRHRVIMPNSALGCGDYGGLTKMFARLQLSGPWHLAKFKDDLTDEAERDELEDAVAEALRPILEKCSTAAISARVLQISHLINERIPEALAGSRPKRQKDESTPSSARRKSSPGEVAPEKSTADGPARAKRPPTDRLLITFDGSAAEDGVGAYQRVGRTHRVDLSKDDPYVAQLIEHRDEQFGVSCLYALAISLFEHGRQEREPELPLDGNFGQRISKLMGLQDAAVAPARSA